jgi:simple sugar transport system ATP-binding protein
MAYIPEDRQDRGLVMDLDLVENALLGSQHSPELGPNGRIDWPATREHAESIIEEYDVRPPDPDSTSESLSGGNQQKFIVGREFSRDPELVVAAHPTRGVDVGSIEFIHERLLELREEGVAIVLISSKLEEVQGLSDRLAVMYEGEFIDVVDPGGTTEEELGLLMAGERPGEQSAGRGDTEKTEADSTDAAPGGEHA